MAGREASGEDMVTSDGPAAGFPDPTHDRPAFRAAMRLRRRALAAAQPDAGDRLAAHLERLPPGASIAVYRAIGSEIDPQPLAVALAARGRSLCLPVVVARDAPLLFRRWGPGDVLEADAAGCPAPLPLAEVIRPDLILVPLLAFDARGGRLGQGGGFYDRTLDGLRRHPSPPGFIGLAFAGQEIAAVPMASHDQRLDGVLTESGYRAFP